MQHEQHIRYTQYHPIKLELSAACTFILLFSVLFNAIKMYFKSDLLSQPNILPSDTGEKNSLCL